MPLYIGRSPSSLVVLRAMYSGQAKVAPPRYHSTVSSPVVTRSFQPGRLRSGLPAGSYHQGRFVSMNDLVSYAALVQRA